MNPVDSLAPRVADAYAHAALPQRVRLLNRLLRPVGPLALVTVSAGAFAGLLPSGRWHVARVSIEDARRISASQVLELAAYVEQKSPDALDRLPER